MKFKPYQLGDLHVHGPGFARDWQRIGKVGEIAVMPDGTARPSTSVGVYIGSPASDSRAQLREAGILLAGVGGCLPVRWRDTGLSTGSGAPMVAATFGLLFDARLVWTIAGLLGAGVVWRIEDMRVDVETPAEKVTRVLVARTDRRVPLAMVAPLALKKPIKMHADPISLEPP